MVRFNDNNEIIRDDEYNAIIVGLQMREDISYSMDELENLAEADGVNVLGRVVQILDRPNTATFIGGGKAEEIAEMCRNMEADTVIFNDELSGVQMRNLEDITGVRVIDRTVLILDIFAKKGIYKGREAPDRTCAASIQTAEAYRLWKKLCRDWAEA